MNSHDRFITILAADKTKRAMWLYRAQNLIWVWVGMATIVTAISFYINPAYSAQHSAVGRLLPSHLDYVWNTMWGAGGLCLIIGIWRFRVRAEVIGHILLGTAIIISDIALWALSPASPNAYLYLFLAFASGGRIVYLWSTTDRDV